MFLPFDSNCSSKSQIWFIIVIVYSVKENRTTYDKKGLLLQFIIAL